MQLISNDEGRTILKRQPPSQTERSELTVDNLDQRSLIDIILLN